MRRNRRLLPAKSRTGQALISTGSTNFGNAAFIRLAHQRCRRCTISLPRKLLAPAQAGDAPVMRGKRPMAEYPSAHFDSATVRVRERSSWKTDNILVTRRLQPGFRETRNALRVGKVPGTQKKKIPSHAAQIFSPLSVTRSVSLCGHSAYAIFFRHKKPLRVFTKIPHGVVCSN
jgi:hypothetical protein